MAVLSIDGRIEVWTDGAEGVLGFAASQAVGQDFVELIVPRWARPSAEVGLAAVRSGSGGGPVGRPWDLPVVGADGTPTTVHAVVDRVPMGDDEVIVVALEEASSRWGSDGPAVDVLRTLFDRAPEIITVTGPDGHQIMVNSAGLGLLGYDESLQQPPDGAAFVHPDDLPLIVDRQARLAAGDRALLAQPMRFRVRAADDRWHWLEMVTADLSDVPEVGGRVGFSRDVTDSEERAIALRESEARLEVLISGFRGPALLHDQRGTIIGLNDALARFAGLGASAQDLVGEPVQRVVDVVLAQVVDDARALLHRAIVEGVPTQVDVELVDGRSYEATYVPIVGDERSFGGLWLFHDVSERKRVARRREELLALERDARSQAELQSELLRRADQARNEFLASLSHELRTPLTSIASATELMLSDVEHLDEASQSYLTMIGRNATRLHRMVEDLLLVGRMAEGMLELDLVDVPVAAVVADAVASLRPLAEQRNVTLEVLAEGDVRASVDPFRLAQVVENLVANSIRYGPEGGSVQVRVAGGESSWSLQVDDDGPGIADEHRDTVFERFRRLPSVESSAGAGLGLSIVQGIVMLHGGQVRVGRSPAGGARFTCTLPLRP
jgi:PAS domain S-box-containing protein